jgi:hypothetical protein
MSVHESSIVNNAFKEESFELKLAFSHFRSTTPCMRIIFSEENFLTFSTSLCYLDIFSSHVL